MLSVRTFRSFLREFSPPEVSTCHDNNCGPWFDIQVSRLIVAGFEVVRVFGRDGFMLMRSLDTQFELIHRIPYQNVSPGRRVVVENLELMRAQVDELPDALDGIVVTADLQGLEEKRIDGTPSRLLGEVLAEDLSVLAELGEIPPLDCVGVILAGDLYARPGLDRRGGAGDVRVVWEAFATNCRWVAGVAGNHDMFGPDWSESHLENFRQQPGIHFLDGDTVELDELKIAGLSGIVGNPRRPFRRYEDDFVAEVLKLAERGPSMIVMHDGPDGDEPGLKGWASVREFLEMCRPTLVVRGHTHWHKPLATLANGTQVLNVDSRALLLARPE